MATKIFFIHSVSNLYTLFNELCAKHLSEVNITHMSDESLIQRALAAGGLTSALHKRVCEMVCAAEEAGADIIQVTCSSLSPAVKVAAQLVKIPVLTIDEPVATMMVEKYKRIGLIATATSTLKPSTQLLKERAQALNKNIELFPVLCEGAYDAFFRNDMKKHDEIVLKNLRELTKKVDAVLLAQVSMTRIVGLLKEEEKIVPIESSPEYAILNLKKIIHS